MPWVKDQFGNEILIPAGGVDYFQKQQQGSIVPPSVNPSVNVLSGQAQTGWVKDQQGNETLIPAGGFNYFQTQQQQPVPVTPSRPSRPLGPELPQQVISSTTQPAAEKPGILQQGLSYLPDLMRLVLPKDSVLQPLLKSEPFKAGIGDITATAGGALEWAGAEQAGKGTRELGELWQTANDVPMKPYSGWRSFLDPEFYETTVMRGLPFTMSLIPAAILGGLGGGAVAGAGAGALGLGALGTTILSTLGSSLGATALSRPLESALEAGGTYNQARNMGFPEEASDKAASEVFKKNLALSGMDIAEFATAFLPVPKGLKGTLGKIISKPAGRAAIGLGKLGVGAVMEAGEEGIQEVFQRQALGDERSAWNMLTSPDQQTKEAMALGGLYGAGFGLSGHVLTAITDRTINKMSPEQKAVFEDTVKQNIVQGVPEPEAVKKALDDYAGSEEGQKTVQEATKEMVEELQKIEQEQMAPARPAEPIQPVQQPVGPIQQQPAVEIPAQPKPVIPENLIELTPSDIQDQWHERYDKAGIEKLNEKIKKLQEAKNKAKGPAVKVIQTKIKDFKTQADSLQADVETEQMAVNDAVVAEATKIAKEINPNLSEDDLANIHEELNNRVFTDRQDHPDSFNKPLKQIVTEIVNEYTENIPGTVSKKEETVPETTQTVSKTEQTVPETDLSDIQVGQELHTRNWGKVEVVKVDSGPRGINSVVLKTNSGGTPTVGIVALKKILIQKPTEKPVVESKEETISQIQGVKNIGYHAGDLGKTEHLARFHGSNRGTGHFGTGTYFVGDKKEIDLGGYKDRPVQEVDFTGYNLFKPVTHDRADKLHEGLKFINDSTNYYESGMTLQQLFDAQANGKDDSRVRTYQDRFKDLYSLFYEGAGIKELLSSRGGQEFFEKVLMPILDEIYGEVTGWDYKWAYDKTDSASTRFMKKLGYEGVDVRGIKGFDNTKYGSVIYDLKTGQEEVAKTPEPVVESKQEVTEKATPSITIANSIKSLLEQGKTITPTELFRLADEAFGGTQAQGKYTPKDAYDAMELGINMYLLERKWPVGPATTLAGARQVLKAIQTEILSKIPTQTKRTAEQDEFQQFSTPPNLAYVAAWTANITSKDVVLEPSAGIGGLAVFAKTAGAEVIVNELSPRRAELLKEMGFDRIYAENAEQLNNILLKDVKPTVVIMNPPFSSTAGRMQGKNDTKNAILHIEQALKRLTTGGRLVAVVGKGMADNTPTFKSWWDKTKEEYNVRANIGIDGKNYVKYGTSFDNQLVVIDKDGPTKGEIITGNVTNLDDALSLLEVVKLDRITRTDRQTQQTTGEEFAFAAKKTKTKEWLKYVPSEIFSRFEDYGEDVSSLDQVIDEAKYVISVIEDGGSSYNDEADGGKKLLKQLKNFVKKFENEEYTFAAKKTKTKKASKPKPNIDEELKSPDYITRAENISPKAARKMGEKLAELLNTVIRAGRHTRGTLGTFNKKYKAGKVKKQKIENWRVMGHEMAHGISFILLDEANFKPNKTEMAEIFDEMYPGKSGRKTQEGLAEFLMLWFADNKLARETAPKTTIVLEEFLDTHPEVGTAFDEIQAIAEHDLEGDLLAQMANLVAKPKERVKVNIGEEYKVPWYKWIQFQLADFTIPLHDLYEAAVKQGFEGMNPAKLAAISGAFKEKAFNLFSGAPRDEAGRFLLPGKRSLQEIVEEAAQTPHGVQLFDWIYHALRYQERYEVMEKSGKQFELPKTKEYFDEVVKQARDEYPHMVKLIEEYSEILSEINLRLLVRGGVISEETAEAVRKGSKYYLPLYHVGEQYYAGSGNTRRAAGQGVQRFKGHEGQTMNFIEASLTRLSDTAMAVEINKTMQAIEAALKQPNMGLFGDFPPPPVVAKLIKEGELVKQIQGFLNDEVEIEDEERVIRLFVPGGLKDISTRETILMARHGDQKVYMRVAPDLYRAVLSMKPVTVDWIVKTLATMTQIGRIGALANIRYISNAVTRDIVISKIQSSVGMGERSLIVDFLKGASAAIGQRPEVMDMYIQSGGYGSAPQEVINGILRASVADGLMATPVPGWKRTATNALVKVVTSPLEALRIIEEMPRLAEFEAVLNKELEKDGVTHEEFMAGEVSDELAPEVEKTLIEAAYASRETLVNFGLHGIHEGFRKYARTVQFMQGSIQGVYRFGRQVKNKPWTTAKRMAIYLLPLTLLAWAFSHDDDKYRDMPSESRDRYWWFPIPGLEGFRIALAKPYEYALPANMLERFLDWSFDTEDPSRRKPLEEFITAVKTSFGVPVTSMLLSTIISLYVGKDSFGNPIEPEREESLLPEERYGPGTSKLAINLAKVVATVAGDKTPSPRMIDYFMKNSFGGLGKTVTNILSDPLHPLKWLKADDRPGIEHAPIIGSLIYGSSEGGSRIIDRFYEDKKKAEMLYKTSQLWQKQKLTELGISYEDYQAGKISPDKAEQVLKVLAGKLSQEDARLILSIPVRNMFAKEMSEMRSAQREVLQRKDLTPAQKKIFSLRMNYLQKLAAGYLYQRPIPSVSPEDELTDVQIQDFLRYYDYKVQKAITNALKTKGGPL